MSYSRMVSRSFLPVTMLSLSEPSVFASAATRLSSARRMTFRIVLPSSFDEDVSPASASAFPASVAPNCAVSARVKSAIAVSRTFRTALRLKKCARKPTWFEALSSAGAPLATATSVPMFCAAQFE